MLPAPRGFVWEVGKVWSWCMYGILGASLGKIFKVLGKTELVGLGVEAYMGNIAPIVYSAEATMHF